MALPVNVVRSQWDALKWRIGNLYSAIVAPINHERLVNGIIITAVLLVNVVPIILILIGRQTLAFVFVAAISILPLALMLPEIGILLYCALVSTDLINLIKIASGGGPGGRLPAMVLLLIYMYGRAFFEYMRLPRGERPRIFSIFTVTLLIFLGYYVIHVGVVFYRTFFPLQPTPVISADLLNETYGKASLFIQYVGNPPWWFMVFPAIVILREPARMRRFLYGTVFIVALISILMAIDYIIQLPPFIKAIIGTKAETSDSGYRARNVARNTVLWGATMMLAFLGLNRKLNRPWAYLVYLASVIAIISTKTRSLWGAYAVGVPVVLALRPLWANVRLVVAGVMMLLLLGATMLHPTVNQKISGIVTESYLRLTSAQNQLETYSGTLFARLEEKDKAMYKWNTQGTAFNHLFGFGLDARYGKYRRQELRNYPGISYQREETYIHINWIFFLFKLGIVGILLLIALIGAFFIRAWQVLKLVNNVYAKAAIGGFAAYMVGSILQESFHAQFVDDESVLPFIMSWVLLELIPYWYRRGYLPEDTESVPKSKPSVVSPPPSAAGG